MDAEPTPALPRELQHDAHHELLQLVEELTRCVQEGALAMAMAFLRQLLRQTEMHFAQEERLMRETAFPPDATREHTAQHDAVLKLLREMQRSGGRPRPGSAELGVVLAEVAGWFRDHMAMMDARLAVHLGRPA